MKELLVRLLGAGCDPKLQDKDDCTPTDMAVSPTAWVLWCEAVHAAGLDMKNVLAQDDELHNVVHPAGALDSKYRRVLCTSPPSWSLESQPTNENMDGNPCCEYCTLPEHWTRSRPPFDRTGSYMVDMADYSTHAVFSNHRDGTFCQNGVGWGSCKNSCHIIYGETTYWTKKAISWRKHVAFRLWSDGFLRTPCAAYTWATGLSPEWENIQMLDNRDQWLQKYERILWK
jgi:hypothetical protein